jgi:hypothetical protein
MSTTAASYSAAGRFDHDKYLLRKQALKVFGGSFRIFSTSGDLVLFASMKAFRLREDIRLYTSEDMTTEILTIKARQIIDFSAAYDVVDPTADEKVGALKRRGFKSMLRDEWIIMDAYDQDIGVIREDSTRLAVLRRLLGDFGTLFMPQGFQGEVRGSTVFWFKQQFNPFVLKLDLDFSADTFRQLDRRLGIAAAVLLCAIEGRQR